MEINVLSTDSILTQSSIISQAINPVLEGDQKIFVSVNFEDIFSEYTINIANGDIDETMEADTVTLIWDPETNNTPNAIIELSGTLKKDIVGPCKIRYQFFIQNVEGTYELIGEEETEVTVITAEEALVQYEKAVRDMSEEDIAKIEEDKVKLQEARTTALNAINALDDGDTKTELKARFDIASASQDKAFKLLYLYYSKNNHLMLYKVNHLAGDIPFAVIFKNDVLIGKATEAFYYEEGSDTAVSMAIADPKTTKIMFKPVVETGTRIYIFKIDGQYRRAEITTVDGMVTAIDDIEIVGIDEEGNSYTVPEEIVNRKALEDLIAAAMAALDAHEAGNEPGNVPEEQRNAFSEAIDDAKKIFNDEDAQQNDIDNAKKALETAQQSFETFIIKYYIDKDGLQTAINDAKERLLTLQIGTEPGQTTEEAKTAFSTAISNATSVLTKIPNELNYTDKDKYDKYVQEIADQLKALEDANKALDDAIITTASYAEQKLSAYEKAAAAFLENIRKKICI